MTRISDAYTASASLQTLNEEQRLDKARLRLRKRRNALFRAMQRRELERAQQLRTRALAKRGIKKFTAKKPSKPHAHPHAVHHKLPSRREHVHPHQHLVERRERDREQGRQQGGDDSNQQQQQQGDEQEQQKRRSREEQQQGVELGSRKPGIRASTRMAARPGAEAAVTPSPTSIQEAVGRCRNPEQAEEVLVQAYFARSTEVFDKAGRVPSPPPRSPETQTDRQRRNLLLPLKLLLPGNPLLHRRGSGNPQSNKKAVERNEALQRVVSLSPPVDKPSAGAKRGHFTEESLRVDKDLLEALSSHDVSPVVEFDRIKAYLSERSAASAA
jgi:hypothetical protein